MPMTGREPGVFVASGLSTSAGPIGYWLRQHQHCNGDGDEFWVRTPTPKECADDAPARRCTRGGTGVEAMSKPVPRPGAWARMA
jgi:hypothetical protein